MFGKNYTLEVKFDKASVIAAIAFVGASCACFMISQGLVLFIRGHKDYRLPRIKGLIMLVCGLCLLAANLTAVLRSDTIAAKIAEYLEHIKL